LADNELGLAAWQLKGALVVVDVEGTHPRLSCWQHQIFFGIDHFIFQSA